MTKTLSHPDEYTQHTEINLFDFIRIYQNFGDIQKKIFWLLHGNSLSTSEFSLNQKNIADKVKCSRKHVNQTLSLLYENRFLARNKTQTTNVYVLRGPLNHPNLNKIIQAFQRGENE